MKQLTKLMAGLTLAAGALLSTGAMAAPICTGCNWANGEVTGLQRGLVYLGSHNPNTGDVSSFTHTDIATGATIDASFEDWWYFNISPAGATAVQAIFIPTVKVTNLSVELYGPSVATCTTINDECTAIGATGPLLATGITSPNFVSNIDFLTLASGLYMFKVKGLALTGGIAEKAYSGNLTTAVIPEPGTLALVAGAILAAGAASRRRKV